LKYFLKKYVGGGVKFRFFEQLLIRVNNATWQILR